MNTSHKPHFSRKKKIWLAVVAGLMVVVLGWWTWDQLAPRPLGDRLEYLGKEDYGNIIGFDSRPYSVYFYETDMDANEAVEYFTNTSVVEKPGTSASTSFTLKAASGETFRVNFYTKDFFEEKYNTLPKPEHNYVLSVPSFKYDIAKGSL